MSHTLLALDHGHPGQMDTLAEHFDIIRPKGRDPEAIIRDHSGDIRALTTYLTPVRKPLIAALPNLEIIACGAVGTDHIDLDTCKSRGIAVSHTPDVLTDDTADTGILLMLNVMRRAVEGDAYIRAGLWKSKGPMPLGANIRGKTMGIVGLGRIGRAAAKRAEAFGMRIIYHGPSQKDDVSYTYFSNLLAMAEESDVLMLTCPGGAATKDIINTKVLFALGPKGYVINIARGSVVKEDDLLIALRNKSIAGAGLDVFAHEPDVPQALFTMDNVVLTPHIGSATVETRTVMGRLVVDNLLAHFAGKRLKTPVF